jgi:hypothetical protein
VGGVRIHRTTVLPGNHVRWAGTPPRTIVARSVVDAAAFQQTRLLPGELAGVLNVMPRSRRRALVIETAALAARGAHALTELNLVTLCRRHHLPTPDQQVYRKDSSGRARYLDAYWAAYRLHVEVDG